MTPADGSSDTRRTVLVVDDFDDTRLLLRTWFERRGFRVIEAENGVEAINRAETESPDLIIMDVQMPQLDGLSATRRIRDVKELGSVPIVAVSAYGAEQFRDLALAAGCNEYVSTPLNPQRSKESFALSFTNCIISRMLRSLLFLLAIALPVSAQCTQKMASLPAAPELHGFRLGMTRDQIKALVPQTVFGHTDHFGVAKTTINPHFDPKIDQTKYEGVRSISLDLLDDRLTSLWIGYDETFQVQAIDEFVKVVSKSLQLDGAWSSWRSRGQQMRCADFQLIVTTLAGGPSLRLLDFAADDTIAARRQAKEEQDAAAEAGAASGGENGGENGQPAAEIIGDKQTKTYYPNGCQPAKEIAEANKAVFKTAEEAEKAGFKLAKNCH